MNAASIVSVVTVFGLVLLSLLALCAEKGMRPIRRTRRGFRRLPAWEKTFLALFVGAWIAFASVKEGTNDVDQVEGDTNTVSGLLTQGFFGRPNPASDTTPAITEDDIARMWRISSTTDAGCLVAPTANAVTNADWRDYGGMSDARRIKPGGWRFPYGDKATDGLTVFQNGDFRPNVKTHFFPRPFDANLSLLPRLNWRLLPDGRMSVFWHEHTSSNSLVLTWHNALYNRDASCPTNFQAELFADGCFDYRYPDRTVRYAPVFPFDWDGDGLENSVDPDPQTANPIDAHGANDEWRRIVCSNVFESVGGAVSFRDDVNTNAYYFVEVCAERGPAPIYFNPDRDSRIGSPVIVANGGETNHVPLLIGVEYVVTSTVPISVAFNDVGFTQVRQNDERSYVVKWPLAFHFAEGTPGLYTVSAVPYDPGVTYEWESTSNGDEPGGRTPLMSAPTASECHCWSGTGATVRFSCSDNCGCGGDCLANGTASMESASFAVTGGVCRCSLPDDPHSDDSPSSPPDPLVGGLEIRFSNRAVIFEDVYRNTDDGPLVPRRSTTTRLTISASGGTYGGSFSLTLQNLDKLTLVGGAGLVSPVTSKVLAPYETYYATFECEGEEASGEEDDVVVEGTFTEAVTWRTVNASDAATVVQLELEAVFDAPENHRQDRHVYGVGEQVRFKVTPALSAVSIKAKSYNQLEEVVTHYNSFAGDGEVDGSATRVYTCPIASTYVPDITVSYGGIIHRPSLEIVEPQEVVTPCAEWDGGCFPTYTVGEAGMITTNYIGPMHVSFQGIAVSEIPCGPDDAIPPTGYFTNCVTGLFHGPEQCSNIANWIKNGNYWTMDDSYSAQTAGTNWCPGTLVWKIPVGWHRKHPWGNGDQNIDGLDYEFYGDTNNVSRPLLIGGRRDLYLQTREILSDGTFRSEKFGHWITRGTWCRIILNGSTIQWFRFH